MIGFCIKCDGAVAYSNSREGHSHDLLNWHCKDCGYVDTWQARRKRRIRNGLLAVSIFLVLTIFSVGLIASFLSQLNAEELRKACSVVLGLVIFVGGAWSYFQLNDGGFQQLINDLKKKDKHDEK